MTTRKRQKGKPGPKPGFQPAVNLRRAAEKAALAAAAPPLGLLAVLGLTAPAPLELEIVVPRRHPDPLQRSRFIRSMEGAELKEYAAQVGVRKLDIDSLTDDRLRQNCMHKVASLVEALTE